MVRSLLACSCCNRAICRRSRVQWSTDDRLCHARVLGTRYSHCPVSLSLSAHAAQLYLGFMSFFLRVTLRRSSSISYFSKQSPHLFGKRLHDYIRYSSWSIMSSCLPCSNLRSTDIKVKCDLYIRVKPR